MKNVRINSEARLVSSDRELSLIKYDFVFFSETRCGTQDVFVEGGPRLVWSNDASARSPASGVSRFVNRQWSSGIKKTTCLNDRAVAVDSKISRTILRLISVYIHYIGCARK